MSIKSFIEIPYSHIEGVTFGIRFAKGSGHAPALRPIMTR